MVEGDKDLCGSYHKCEIACGSLYELYLPDENGVMTNYTLDPSIPLDRDSISKFQNYGITNFDNIGSSYLTIFQCTTLEGWSHIMVMIVNSYSTIVSQFFFISCVVICAYFLLNLTIAVMLDKFKRLKQKSTDKIIEKYEMNQQRVKNLKQLDQILDYQNKLSIRLKLQVLYSKIIYQAPGEPPDDIARYDYFLCRLCWKINNIPLFNSVIMCLIIANTVVLATDKYPTPEKDLISQSNQVFNVFFALECAIKLIGLTFQEWKQDIFNVFDLIIVISSSIEMMISKNSTAIISALRAIRLLRLIKLARSNFTLRFLLDSMAITIS